MAYKIDVSAQIEGKPRQSFCCDCPDEACFLNCVAVIRDAHAEMDATRKAKPHDKRGAAKCCKCELTFCATCDGAPHVDVSETFHDVPDYVQGTFDSIFSQTKSNCASKGAKVS